LRHLVEQCWRRTPPSINVSAMRKILLGAMFVLFALVAALAGILWFAPSPPDRKPALAASTPLKPAPI